jgi:hypothetical protein
MYSRLGANESRRTHDVSKEFFVFILNPMLSFCRVLKMHVLIFDVRLRVSKKYEINIQHIHQI